MGPTARSPGASTAMKLLRSEWDKLRTRENWSNRSVSRRIEVTYAYSPDEPIVLSSTYGMQRRKLSARSRPHLGVSCRAGCNHHQLDICGCFHARKAGFAVAVLTMAIWSGCNRG